MTPMTLIQMDVVLGQVIKARARAESTARDARIAAKTLASLQKLIEVAIVDGALDRHDD